MARRREHGQGVGDVVLAGQVPLHGTLDLAVEAHLEARAIGAEQTRLPLATFTSGLHGRPAAHLDHPRQRGFAGRVDDQAFAGNDPHQMVELPLDSSQIREDVRVIELQVVEDRCSRAVVDELAALVEEGAVVLVGLDHEERRAAQARGNTEILRHAADQKARAHAGMFQHPGQHAGTAGLAVGTGHRQHPAPLQHVIGQPLRAGNVGQPLVQHVFHRRVATAHGIAHHHQIRCRLQVRRIKALHQLNALGFQLSAHGRVNVGIGAGDAMAELFGQNSQRPHESAADTENMDVH